jgi:hypothetical protein
VSVDLGAVDLERVAELRWVDDVDFQIHDVGGAGEGVNAALGGLLCRVFGGVAGLPAVGDDVEGPVVGDGVGDEAPGCVVEFDVVGPQFGRAGNPRDQRDGDAGLGLPGCLALSRSRNVACHAREEVIGGQFYGVRD